MTQDGLSQVIINPYTENTAQAKLENPLCLACDRFIALTNHGPVLVPHPMLLSLELHSRKEKLPSVFALVMLSASHGCCYLYYYFDHEHFLNVFFDNFIHVHKLSTPFRSSKISSCPSFMVSF